MITIRTTRPITEAEAIMFAKEQKDRNVRILNFPEADCVWQLEVDNISPNLEQFRANVKWYQLTPYETGELDEQDEPVIGTMKVQIFAENFVLEATEIQQIWEYLDSSITPEDNFLEELNSFVANGVLVWCGAIRNIFAIGINGFEIV